MKRLIINCLQLIGAALLLLYGWGSPLRAEAQSGSLLNDDNGDGQVRMLAFGDSITWGVGDGEQPGANVPVSPDSDGNHGYPRRIQDILHLPVENDGVNADALLQNGIKRLPGVLLSSAADVVILYEGNTDAENGASRGEFGVSLQRAVNVVRLLNKVPVMVTEYPTCCNHGSDAAPFLDGINEAKVDVATENSVPIADVDRAWRTTCDKLPDCNLLNLPEGLHPNSRGYDVIAQTILATLVGVDIFSADGARELESALGLSTGSVIVKPGS